MTVMELGTKPRLSGHTAMAAGRGTNQSTGTESVIVTVSYILTYTLYL